MSISNFDAAFPPLHKAVFDGEDATVFALIASHPVPRGLELEVPISFSYYDFTTEFTTLGTAVNYFSSVAVSSALLDAGATPLALQLSSGPKTPLQLVQATRKAAREMGTIDSFGEFWLDFCGRAPTAEWFDEVTALLVKAEVAARRRK